MENENDDDGDDEDDDDGCKGHPVQFKTFYEYV